jgi:predicted  nucleic acid-binding Zn-ribbon protein
MIFNSSKWKSQEEFNHKSSLQLKALDTSLQTSFGHVKSDVEHIKHWIIYLHKNQDNMSETISKIDHKITSLLTKNEIKSFVDEYYHNMNTINSSISNVNQEVSGIKQDISTVKWNVLSVKGDISAFQGEMSTIKGEFQGEISRLRSSNKSIFEQLEALSRREFMLKDELRNEFKSEIRAFKQDLDSTLNRKIEQIPTPTLPPAIFQRLDDLNRRIGEFQSNKEQITVSTRNNLKEKIFRKVTRHSKDYVKSMLISLIKKYDKISGLNLREIVVEEQGIVSKSSFYRLLSEIEEEDGIQVLHEGKEKHYFWTLNTTPNAK